MKIPALLLPMAVIFWGIESRNMLIALPMAALLAGAAYAVPSRKLSEDDFVRISDFTSIVFLTAIALVVLNVKGVLVLKTLMCWMVLILSPLVVAQLYANSEKIVIGTRLGFGRNRIHRHNPIDFRFFYLATCLFSAASVNSRSSIFFLGAASLLLWFLLANRGKSYPLLTFILLSTIPLGVGYYLYNGAEQLQLFLRDGVRSYMNSYYSSKYADPFQSTLSFGDLGAMKSSGKIVLRAQAQGGMPSLFRQASYETFNDRSWYSRKPFEYLEVASMGWDLLADGGGSQGRELTIEYYLPKEKGLLPQPYGAYRLTGPTIFELEQKNDGISRIIDGAVLVTYAIRYRPGLIRSLDIPTVKNLAIHQDEREILDSLPFNIPSSGVSNKVKVAAVERFFAEDYAYSLKGGEGGDSSTPLETFLLHDKVGHCEFFATAATLLLRYLGVPSRYVTGFAVDEYSKLEKRYIVRERHAHAWTEAYVDGRWIVVDTTPADWLTSESAARSRFEKFQDIAAYLRFRYDRFRIETEQKYTKSLSVAIVLLALFLGYRIYRRMSNHSVKGAEQLLRKDFSPIESPFYAVERRLIAIGEQRGEREPFLQWVQQFHTVRDLDLKGVKLLYTFHQRHRYDPSGLSPREWALFVERGEAWLKGEEERTMPVDKNIR